MKTPFCLLILLLISCNKPESEKPQEPPNKSTDALEIDKILTEAFEEKDFYGTILVAKGDSIIYANGFGKSGPDSENGISTYYKIASLSKSLTAVLILKLCEEGNLKLEDDIGSFLPEKHNPEYEKITVHQLLSHSSGIPDYTQMPGSAEIHQKRRSPEKLIRFFANAPSNFRAGTDFEYSNSGYAMLGYIAEKVTGKDYGSLLEEYIFSPLEMENSSYYDEKTFKTYSYDRQSDKLEFNTSIDMSVPYAAGGIQSTVTDMFRFSRALNSEGFLPDSLRIKMFEPNFGRYGYGWFLMNVPSFAEPEKEMLVAEHGGTIPGFTAQMNLIPEDEIFIISLNNMEGPQLLPLHIRIAKLLYIGSGKKYPNEELIQIN